MDTRKVENVGLLDGTYVDEVDGPIEDAFEAEGRVDGTIVVGKSQ